MELLAPIIFAVIFFLVLLGGVAFWCFLAFVPNKSSFEKGLEAFENNDFEKAKKMFLAAHEETPESKEVQHNLGLTLLAAEDYNEAIKHFDGILQFERDDIDALYNLGLIYFRKGDYVNAKSYFEKVLENKPDDFNALFNLALTYQMQKDYETSIILYNRALELSPKDVDCFFNLSIIEFDQKEYKKALEICQKAKKINPERTDILFLILRCKDEMCAYENPKEIALILSQYSQLSTHEDIPSDFDAYWARALAKNGDIDQSLEICEKIVAENRQSAIVYRLLGLIKLLQNEIDEAKNALQKAIGLETYEPETYNLLSYVFAQEGNVVEQVNFKSKYQELLEDETPLLIG